MLSKSQLVKYFVRPRHTHPPLMGEVYSRPMDGTIRPISFAEELAREAGALMRERFVRGMKKEWKGDGTPLTVTDTEVNALVLARIADAFPGHGVLSEEGSAPSGSEWTWVCDPIDGTVPFSHGYPSFTFSLALTHDGVPVLGVVYDPMADRLYAAESGKGATVNGMQLTVSANAALSSESVIGLDGASRLPGLFDALKWRGHRVVAMDATVYSSMLVASGEFCAEVYGSRKAWDAAAVKVIVEEAGGKVTSLTGADQRYDRPIDGFLASGAGVHAELLELVRPFVAPGTRAA